MLFDSGADWEVFVSEDPKGPGKRYEEYEDDYEAGFDDGMGDEATPVGGDPIGLDEFMDSSESPLPPEGEPAYAASDGGSEGPPPPVQDGYEPLGAVPVQSQQPSPARSGLNLSPLWKALAAVGLPILNALQKLGRGIGAVFEHLLPDESSSTVLAVIAVATDTRCTPSMAGSFCP